jgi:hypothetical protein
MGVTWDESWRMHGFHETTELNIEPGRFKEPEEERARRGVVEVAYAHDTEEPAIRGALATCRSLPEEQQG